MNNDKDLLRYSRHLLLDEIGFEGQDKINQARVLVIGCGGLGASALPYLAASGVGYLYFADHDVIELSNLQRQILFTEHDLGKNKAQVMQQRLQALNPDIHTHAITNRLDFTALCKVIHQEKIQYVVDCSDNFTTRKAINHAICQEKISLISGAAVRFAGQLALYQPHLGTACYECLFAGEDASDGACATFGVFSPLVGIVGSMQAALTLRTILGLTEQAHNQLQSINAQTGQWQSFAFSPDPNCPCCQQYKKD